MTSHGYFEYRSNVILCNLVWKHICNLMQSFILDDPDCITSDHETAYFSRVRGLVAIQHSADAISRVYELEGVGERGYIAPPSIPIFSSVSASKRLDNISKVFNKSDRPSTIFETLLHSGK